MTAVELHTIGRKSGLPRSSMLTSPIHDESRVVLVASKGGNERDPLWYGNLRANPDVEVTMNGATRAMRARTASKDEKAELWPEIVATYKNYAQYQERSGRDIPVVICGAAAFVSRVGSGGQDPASGPTATAVTGGPAGADRSTGSEADTGAGWGRSGGNGTMPPMSMEPAGPGGDALDLSMAVSQLASNSTDLRLLLKLLVSQLSDALGDRMTVERAAGSADLTRSSPYGSSWATTPSKLR